MIKHYEWTDISSPVRPNFCKLFSSIKILRQLTYFSRKYLLCIYNYLLKTWITVGVFDVSTFSMVWWLFSLHLMKIFPMTHNFWEKNIVKHCKTVVKYVKLAKTYTYQHNQTAASVLMCLKSHFSKRCQLIIA